MTHSNEEVALIPDQAIRRFTLAAALAALTGVLAQISIPIPLSPAPISFQVIPVYFAGILLGPVWGAGSVLLYIVAGALGAPIFSNASAGLGVILGPNGGFIIGFFFAAIAIGLIIHKGIETQSLSSVSVWTQAVALVIGLFVIYGIGVPWLKFVAGFEWIEAIITGAVVFLPGDIIKIIAVLGVITGSTRLQAR